MSRPTTVTTFVPFSTWSPDLGLYDNPGLMEAENLIPFGDGGFCTPLAWDSGYALTKAALGIGTHPDTTNLFYGATDDLREVVLDVSDTQRRGAVYTAEALPIGWSFVPFGGDIIAVGGITQRPQYRDADTAGNFADLLDATTLARTDLMPRYACPVGQHIMFGYINDATPAPDVLYPDRVWISAINNARRFGTQATDPTLLTTYQDLYDDYGHITGLSGGNDYAYIFKQKAIYRMDFAGPFGLTFKPIALGTGTVAPHSIVEVDGDVYFWSGNGPAVIRQGGTVVNLVSTSMSRMLMSQDNGYPSLYYGLSFNTNIGRTRGWFCPFSRCVCWTYDATVYTIGDAAAATLALQVDSGTWGYIHQQVSTDELVRGAAAKYLVPGNKWEFGGLQFMASGNATPRIYRYTGATADSVVTTSRQICRELLGDKYTSAKVVRVRPRLRHSVDNITFDLVVRSFNDTIGQGATQETTVDETSLDASGYLSCETDIAQVFEFSLTIGGALQPTERIYELAGIEVEFDVADTKG